MIRDINVELSILFGCELPIKEALQERQDDHMRDAVHLSHLHTHLHSPPHCGLGHSSCLEPHSLSPWLSRPYPLFKGPSLGSLLALPVLNAHHLWAPIILPLLPFLGVHLCLIFRVSLCVAPQARDGLILLCVPRGWRWERGALSRMLQAAQQPWEQSWGSWAFPLNQPLSILNRIHTPAYMCTCRSASLVTENIYWVLIMCHTLCQLLPSI